MRLFTPLLLALPAAPATAQTPAERPVTLLRSAAWEMTGETGRRYRIAVAWPDAPAPPEGFPVLYVLDADVLFATAAETVRSYARGAPARHAIVVGIGYPDDLDTVRERRIDMAFRTKAAGAGAVAGADAFLTFIADRLKPEIGRSYRIDATREAMFGHSFGGLFAGWALLKRPDLFDRWMIASPSVWYGDRWILSDAAQRPFASATKAVANKPDVLVTVGAYEQAPDPDFVDPRAAELATLRQVDGARDLAAALNRAGAPTRYELIERENHGSVIPVALARAARFLFAPSGDATRR